MNGPPSSPPTRYTIRVASRLDARWAGWFDGFSLAADEQGTTLTGAVADQAQLHGLLAKVRDLGLDLVSVTANDDAASVADETDNADHPTP
jgi:hypothetical protein